jgi:hypothetical protein
LIHSFIRKSFTKVKSYSLHYLDDDEDQITLDTDEDLKVYLQETNKKPKIFVIPLNSKIYDESVKINIEEEDEKNIEEVVESLKKVEVKDEPKEEKTKE